jgi:hypothetical protein
MLVSVHIFASQVLIVTGHESLLFFSGLTVLIFRLGGVIIATPYGLEVIAWSIVGSGVVDLLIKTWAVKKSTGLSVRRLAASFIPGMSITILCWLVVTLIDQLMPYEETNPWQSIAVIFICLSTTWLISIRLTKHEAWDIVIDIYMKLTRRQKIATGS